MGQGDSSYSSYCETESVKENSHIHEKSAVLDVIEVVLDILVDGKRSVGAQLPQASQSWDYLQSAPLLDAVAFHDKGHLRSWTH